MKTATKRITISGNWRDGGPEREWAGSGTVDQHGTIECAADIGDESYEAIEEQLAGGAEDGTVTVEIDGRDVTYYWSIEE